MVSDFPTLSKFTSDAFFADDCTIWRSGNNIAQIVKHLQSDLDIISEWCRAWGFVINVDNKIIDPASLNLSIQGRRIIFNNSCKLLGIVFDSRLSWKSHIEYLIDRSKRALNVMRCISGTDWGSNKVTLLILYRSLILSYFDYCSFVYSTSSSSNLKK